MSEPKQSMFVLPDGKSVRFTFILVSSLFLLWGVCNGMIDVMDKHFQDELGLTKAQSANVQFAHYLGYFLMALPAGWLARRFGWKGGIIAGLLLVAVGGFWFLPATGLQAAAHAGSVSKTTAFVGYLIGVCAIASGLTFLETVANPYTTVLGPARYAATRINLAQSCNGVGWILGPIIGAQYFYSKDPKIYFPYVATGILVLVLAAVFKFAYVPEVRNEDDYHIDDSQAKVSHSLLSRWHFTMGVLAQFLYVAAQAGIFSFFINCMTVDTKTSFCMVPAIPEAWNVSLLERLFETGKDGLLHISSQGAANLASAAFVCFLLGRISGAFLLKKFSPHKVLGFYGTANIVVCLLVFFNLGWISAISVFLSYFFMSIMFPTIFALGIFGLGDKTKKASAFLVMAIMGGAVLPKLMGHVADVYDMSRSFIVPMCCFVFIACYGYLWPKLSGAKDMHGVQTAGGH
ncbi:MAG TPA: sugar MFS transporter [Candidatus Hydrogenedentes bacterium]|nr:sugar MFS transporter [Candidatus Hydrogenedentota bacterium]